MQLLDNTRVSPNVGVSDTEYEFWLYVDPDDDDRVIAEIQRHSGLVVDWNSEACIDQIDCEAKSLSPGDSTPAQYRYTLKAPHESTVYLDVALPWGDQTFEYTLFGTYEDPDGGGGGGGGGDVGLRVLSVSASADGETITAETTVDHPRYDNDPDPASGTIECTVEGTVEHTQPMQLDPGEFDSFTWSHTVTQDGDYELCCEVVDDSARRSYR